MGRSRQAAIGATFPPIGLAFKVRAMAGGALHRIRGPPSFEIDDRSRPDSIRMITAPPDHHPRTRSNRSTDRDHSEKSEHLPAHLAISQPYRGWRACHCRKKAISRS